MQGATVMVVGGGGGGCKGEQRHGFGRGQHPRSAGSRGCKTKHFCNN